LSATYARTRRTEVSSAAIIMSSATVASRTSGAVRIASNAARSGIVHRTA
jgi:hypothetical protein